jgi:hypothetical protein
MEIIFAILLLGFAAAPIALVGGWLAGRGHGRLGALVIGPGGDGWWRSTMPWPKGVQEDDDFKWNFGDRIEPIAGADPVGPAAAAATDEVELAPTRLRPRTRIR